MGLGKTAKAVPRRFNFFCCVSTVRASAAYELSWKPVRVGNGSGSRFEARYLENARSLSLISAGSVDTQ